MSNPLDYNFYANIPVLPRLITECLALPDEMEETRPPKPYAPYEEFLPEQVGFFRKLVPGFEIPGLESSVCSHQVIHQKPGRLLPWHIDEFDVFKEEHGFDNVRTYLLFLEDWCPGQVFGTELSTFTHWNAGDIICWDYLIWHYTSNASLKPKLTCQIIEGY